MVRPARAHGPLTVAALSIAALGMVAAGVKLGIGESNGDPRAPSEAFARPAAQLVTPARPALTFTRTDASISSVDPSQRLLVSDTSPVPAPGPQSVPAPGPTPPDGDDPGALDPVEPLLPVPIPDPLAALVDAAVDAVEDAADTITEDTSTDSTTDTVVDTVEDTSEDLSTTVDDLADDVLDV